MSDEQEEGTFEPDGWGVYHHWATPVDDVHGYMFGPFPTYDIAKYIMEASPCKCETALVPLMFPKGIVMMAGLDAIPEEVKEAMEALRAGGRRVRSPNGQSHLSDRVH